MIEEVYCGRRVPEHVEEAFIGGEIFQKIINIKEDQIEEVFQYIINSI